MLLAPVLAYFVVGAMFVAFAGGEIPRSYREIAADKGRGHAVYMIFAAVLFVMLLWPYVVFAKPRPR
jgi:hypothetical protein